MGRERGIFQQTYTRREVLRRGIFAAVTIPFLRLREGFTEQKTEQESQPIFADVFGLHILGGGDFKDLTIHDIQTLRAKSVLAIEPDKEMLAKLTAARVPFITRIYSEDNEYTGELKMKIRRAFLRSEPFVKHLYVEPFNEPNLYHPDITPEEHAKDFVNAAMFIKRLGGTPLLTPLAAPYEDDLEWLSRFLHEIKKPENFPKLMEQTNSQDPLALSLHGYFRNMSDDPVSHMQKQNERVKKILGVTLPLYATEAGIQMHAVKSLSEEEEAEVAVRLLSSPIPNDLSNIQALFWWTLADRAQIRDPEPLPPGAEDWSDQALRYGRENLHSVTPTYLAIQKLMEKLERDRETQLNASSSIAAMTNT